MDSRRDIDRNRRGTKRAESGGSAPDTILDLDVQGARKER
jgi:hypothetical protein